MAGFELAIEDDGGIGEFLFFGRLNLALKKVSAGPVPGQGHEGHAFFQIAVAGQQRERCLAPLRSCSFKCATTAFPALFFIQTDYVTTLFDPHLQHFRTSVHGCQAPRH